MLGFASAVVSVRDNLEFGLQPARLMVDAINEVLRIATSYPVDPTRVRHLCASIALDVRNAINSAPWPLIDAALRRKTVHFFMIPIFRSFISNQVLLVDSTQGKKNYTQGLM